jgi:hypothetical protein
LACPAFELPFQRALRDDFSDTEFYPASEAYDREVSSNHPMQVHFTGQPGQREARAQVHPIPDAAMCRFKQGYSNPFDIVIRPLSKVAEVEEAASHSPDR